jgi:DNA polymerase V
MLKFIPLKAQAGISGFESPATEYTQLNLTLDQILIDHPAA